MKNKKLKYLFEEKKDKLVGISCAVVGLVAVAGGVWYLAKENKLPFLDNLSSNNLVLAKSVLVESENNTLLALDPKDGGLMGSVPIAEDDFLFRANDLNGAYVYHPSTGTIDAVTVKGGKVKQEQVVQLSSDFKERATKSSNIVSNGDKFLFTSETGALLVGKDKPENVLDDENMKKANQIYMSDNAIYYGAEKTISSIKLKDSNKKTIEVGDISFSFTQKEDKVIAYNQFGSGVGKNMILQFSDGKLEINDLKKLDETDYQIVPSGDEDKCLTYISAEGEKKTKIYVWWIDKENGEKKPDVNTLKSETSVTSKNTVAKSGYIYVADTKANKLEILQTRNGMQTKIVNAKIADSEFVVPVY